MTVRGAAITVNVASPGFPSLVADTVVLPTLAVVAKPFVPASSLTVATAWLDEAQVASVVRSCVDPSE